MKFAANDPEAFDVQQAALDRDFYADYSSPHQLFQESLPMKHSISRRDALKAIPGAVAGLAAAPSSPSTPAEDSLVEQALLAMMDFFDYAEDVIEAHGTGCNCGFCGHHENMEDHLQTYWSGLDSMPTGHALNETLEKARNAKRRTRTLPAGLVVGPRLSRVEQFERDYLASVKALNVAKAAVEKVARYATPAAHKKDKNNPAQPVTCVEACRLANALTLATDRYIFHCGPCLRGDDE